MSDPITLVSVRAGELNRQTRGALRNGQALMNALHALAPQLYTEVSGTKADCFYQDELIPEFLEFLKGKSWLTPSI